MHALAVLLAAVASTPGPQVLAFTKTSAFRHDSIPAAVAALQSQPALAVTSTDDAGAFTDANLARYDVVVFLLTSGDVLDAAQQAALERFVRSGGGFAGVHSASDTEYDWPWYGRLVGAYFRSHPAVQPAVVEIVDPSHPSTSMLPRRWQRTDEWYAFRAPPRGVQVLARLDERTYDAGESAMGEQHPIAWAHEFEGGRAWYTGGGHGSDAWSEPLFLQHVVGGIRWAVGTEAPRIRDVRRRGRVVTARVERCRRCVASAAGVRADVAGGRLRLTVPRGTKRFTLRVENRANGRATAVAVR